MPEPEVDHLLRLSEEGGVDIDESLIKTGWDEDEELDNAFGASSGFSEKEDSLTGEQDATFSGEQSGDGAGGHQHQREGQESSRARESGGSIFGAEEPMEDGFFLGSIELDELDCELLELELWLLLEL